jgi:cyclic pyranopterin phosphate synthase
MPLVTDRFDRPLRNLRLSVTDRCNLRCRYCMPEDEYVWLERDHLLTFEEIDALVAVFTTLGVHRLRLTGGEPLLRRDLPRLVALLARRAGIDDLAITTNGLLLAEQAADLKRAGLGRVTVSLDTLRPERFEALSRRTGHDQVLAGIAAARAAGFTGTKLDTVVMRGVNDDELVELLAFGSAAGAEVRFIEYMDVGGATRWRASDVVPRDEMLARIGAARGRPEPLPSDGSAPAQREAARRDDLRDHRVDRGALLRSCDRARITADGRWYATAPLRDERHRPARAVADGALPRGDRGARRSGVAPARRPRRGGAAARGGWRRAGRLPRGHRAAQRPPPRDAHPRRLTPGRPRLRS